MTVNLSALAGAGQQFFDNNGNPLTGGKLWSYVAGTTTPQTTYTTALGNVAHTNPIILDSAGRISTGEIWLTAGLNYKFVLKTATDVLIGTYDNIAPIENPTALLTYEAAVASSTGSSLVGYAPVVGPVTTVQAKLLADDAGPTTVGNGTVSYALASFYSNKNITQHAWYDFLADGTLDFTNNVQPIVAHATFNDNKQVVGSFGFDHYHSFQSYPHYGCSGTLNRLSGYWSQPDVTAGTVTELSQFKASNALGAGAITKQYGYYCSTLNRGSENWAFFSAGITPSFMGGAQYYGSGVDTVNSASIDYNPGTGYLRFIPRATYGIEAVCRQFKLGLLGYEAIFNNAVDGNLYISARAGYATKLDNTLAEGSLILTSYGVADGIAVKSASGSAYSAADAALYVAKNTVTSRSVNAAGTINASGADYAEYERNNGLSIAKGDVVGFKADGTLTNVFADAIRFGVKSTEPSLVGGDTWGIGLKGNDLEAARQLVDRIAYSGKVPCNVINAIPGGYIIAANDSGAIVGKFVADPDFTQYKKAVGRVNKILPDGRCEIAIIVH